MAGTGGGANSATAVEPLHCRFRHGGTNLAGELLRHDRATVVLYTYITQASGKRKQHNLLFVHNYYVGIRLLTYLQLEKNKNFVEK